MGSRLMGLRLMGSRIMGSRLMGSRLMGSRLMGSFSKWNQIEPDLPLTNNSCQNNISMQLV
jgi:hypothetical protein